MKKYNISMAWNIEDGGSFALGIIFKMLSVLLLVLVLHSIAISQSLRNGKENSDYEYLKRNTIFAELGGMGLLYSLNYERRFPFKFKNINNGISASAGFAFYPKRLIGRNSSQFYAPFQLCYTHQHFRHRFDFGVGSTFYSFSDEIVSAQFVFFRFIQSFAKNDNLEWGLSLSPIVNHIDDEYGVIPWGGVRFGYKFSN